MHVRERALRLQHACALVSLHIRRETVASTVWNGLVLQGDSQRFHADARPGRGGWVWGPRHDAGGFAASHSAAPLARAVEIAGEWGGMGVGGEIPVRVWYFLVL